MFHSHFIVFAIRRDVLKVQLYTFYTHKVD